MLSEMHPISPSLRTKWGVGMAGKGNLRSEWFGDSAENLGLYLEGHGCICLSAFYPPRELVIEGFLAETDRFCIFRSLLGQKFEDCVGWRRARIEAKTSFECLRWEIRA